VAPSRTSPNLIAVLTLLAYVVTSVMAGPGTIVLCHGADGHVAIEPAHASSGCHEPCDTHEGDHDHQCEVGGPTCQDVLLVAGLSHTKARVNTVPSGAPRALPHSAFHWSWGPGDASRPASAFADETVPIRSASLALRTVVLLV
jgi:hypothetical protein